MDYEIYNPTITTVTAVDPYDDPSGLTYVSNSSPVWWQGKYWVIMDGNDQALTEGAAGQTIWLTTSTDGVTWTPAHKPFRDSAHCDNPMTGSTVEWQPNLVVVGDELWCTWCGADTYLSKLTSPTGKWTNYRFEFNGTDVFLSTTITGAASPGRATRATINGHTGLWGFPTQNPVVLSRGAVCCPVVFESFTDFSTQTPTTNTFVKALKWATVLRYAGGTWSMKIIDTTAFGDFCPWEPFVVENPVGDVYVFVRNLNTLARDEDMLLVARSRDRGDTFEPAWSTKLLVPSTRGFAQRVSNRRWLLVHNDHPQKSTQGANQNFSANVRRNGALGFSLKGIDDFIPGRNFSGTDGSMNYPQFTTHDGKVIISYTSGTGLAVRRSLKIVTVDPIPDEAKAYVFPRRAAEFAIISDPKLVSGPPPYYAFNGGNQAVGTVALAATSGVTYAAWVQWDSESDIVIDTRTVAGTGQVLVTRGLALRSLNFYHGLALRPGAPVFLAAVIDNAAQTVTTYVGDGTLHVKVGHFRSMTMTGLPANGDTVTIDGATYTFRTSPSATNDVGIGATVAATLTNLTAKLPMYSNLPGSGKLIVARYDTASFTVASGSTQITVDSSIALDGGTPVVGRASSASNLSTLVGRVHDARVFASALAQANITHLYNRLAVSLGRATVTATATDPGAALITYDPSAPDAVQFPPSGVQVGYCETLGDTLRVFGEGSASVELPYHVSVVTIPFTLGAVPSGTDKYVVATFGTVDSPVRLHVSGADPTMLYADNLPVAAIDPAAVNSVEVMVSTNKINVGSFERYFAGRPRCYLGNAFPQSLLNADKHVDIDVSEMSVTRGRR